MRGSEVEGRLRVALSATHHGALRAALIREGDHREYGAFLFAKVQEDGLLEVIDLELLEASHFKWQSVGYLELRDGALQEMILHAHQTKTALIEAHSHPFSKGQRVTFSRFDEEGLREVAPHVVWRLPGRPYVGLVFGQRAFDGLFWTRPDPEPRGAVDLIVDGTLFPGTGESLSGWGGKR